MKSWVSGIKPSTSRECRFHLSPFLFTTLSLIPFFFFLFSIFFLVFLFSSSHLFFSSLSLFSLFSASRSYITVTALHVPHILILREEMIIVRRTPMIHHAATVISSPGPCQVHLQKPIDGRVSFLTHHSWISGNRVAWSSRSLLSSP